MGRKTPQYCQIISSSQHLKKHQLILKTRSWKEKEKSVGGSKPKDFQKAPAKTLLSFKKATRNRKNSAKRPTKLSPFLSAWSNTPYIKELSIVCDSCGDLCFLLSTATTSSNFHANCIQFLILIPQTNSYLNKWNKIHILAPYADVIH